MKYEDYMRTFIKLFQQDETLLRLLYYQAENMEDNVLVVDENRPWITPHYKSDGTLDTSKPFIGMETYQQIRKDRVLPVDSYDDLKDGAKCRMCFYLGNRRNTRNHLVANQQLVIDLYIHKNYELVNFCMEKICDYLSDQLFNKNIGSGIGKVDEYGGRKITVPSIDQYHAYELIYQFGGEKW